MIHFITFSMNIVSATVCPPLARPPGNRVVSQEADYYIANDFGSSWARPNNVANLGTVRHPHIIRNIGTSCSYDCVFCCLLLLNALQWLTMRLLSKFFL